MATYEFELTSEITAKDIKAKLAAFELLYGECWITLRGTVQTLFKNQLLPASYRSPADVKQINQKFLIVDENGYEGDKNVKVFIPAHDPIRSRSFSQLNGSPPTLLFMTKI